MKKSPYQPPLLACLYLIALYIVAVTSFESNLAVPSKSKTRRASAGSTQNSLQICKSAADAEDPGSCDASTADMTQEVAKEDSANLQPWLDRWDSNKIGFHLDEVNPAILKYWNANIIQPLLDERKDAASAGTVQCFVPLCGKTLDMVYIAEKSAAGDDVHLVGVDGIRKSLEDFGKEQPQMKIAEQPASEGYERFVGPKMTLLKGDFFDFGPHAVDGVKFDAMFDRGSLVAIDPSMRDKYLEVMTKVVAPGARILLCAMERQSATDLEATKKGPPFSISEAMVREMYGALDWVESIALLESEDTFVDNPDRKERYAGLDSLWEHIFVIQAKK